MSVRDDTATFKPRDVEELIDFYFNRRLANLVVAALAPTRVTANQVTWASGVAAVFGLIVAALAFLDPWLMLAAAIIFQFSVVLDCADGQLARLRHTSSLAGRALDGCVDVVSVAAIIVAQHIWLVGAGQPAWLSVLGGFATGLSLRWHAHTYDHVKNVYLHHTEAPSESAVPALPTLEEIDRERREHEAAGRWFSVLLIRFFRGFTEVQRRGRGDAHGDVTSPAARAAYRKRFRWYMRLWTFNGLGTHLLVLVLGTAAAPLLDTAPLWAWGFIAGPMNVFTWILERWRRPLDERLHRELAELEARA